MDRVISEARTYEELIGAIRARRMELGLSHLALDDAIGWAQGYTGKLETKPCTQVGMNRRGNFRALGPESTEALLTALGLKLVVVVDEGASLPRSVLRNMASRPKSAVAA